VQVELAELDNRRAREVESHAARETELEQQRSFLVTSEEQTRAENQLEVERLTKENASLELQVRTLGQAKRGVQGQLDAAAGSSVELSAAHRQREYAEKMQQINADHHDEESERLTDRIQELESKLDCQIEGTAELTMQLEVAQRSAIESAASAATTEVSTEHSAKTERKIRALERENGHLKLVAENNLVLKGEVSKYREKLDEKQKQVESEMAATAALRQEVDQLKLLHDEWDRVRRAGLQWCSEPLETIGQLGGFMAEMQQKVAEATTKAEKAKWEGKFEEQTCEHVKAKLAEAEAKVASFEQAQQAMMQQLGAEQTKNVVCTSRSGTLQSRTR